MVFCYYPAGISSNVPDKALIWMAAYDVPNPAHHVPLSITGISKNYTIYTCNGNISTQV